MSQDNIRTYTLAPKGSSPEALKEHAEGLARVLALTDEQSRILAAEIRNAISPIAIIKEVPELLTAAEALDDLRVSLNRVLSLCNALNPFRPSVV